MSPSDCVLCYIRMMEQPFERERYEFLVTVFNRKRAAEVFDQDYDFIHTDDLHDQVAERVDPKITATFSDTFATHRQRSR